MRQFRYGRILVKPDVIRYPEGVLPNDATYRIIPALEVPPRISPLMSKFCQTCGRGPVSSQSRSHSNIATKRRHEINLQVRTIGGKRMRVCTRCIKTAKKQAA